jgi:hypothetical protein
MKSQLDLFAFSRLLCCILIYELTPRPSTLPEAKQDEGRLSFTSHHRGNRRE